MQEEKKYIEIKEIFMNFFTKEACQILYKDYLLNWIAEGYIGKNLNIFEISIVDKNTPKEFYINLLMEFFLNKENFQKIFKTLDKDLKKIFQEIIWNEKFEIEHSNESKLPRKFMFFKIKHNSNSSFLYLDRFFIKVLRKNIENKPKDYYLYDSKEESKKIKKMYKSNNEKEFLLNFDKYVDFFLSGEINKSNDGKVLKESKRNIIKHCNITEYYEDLKNLEHLKAEIISLFLLIINEKYVNHKFLNSSNMKNIINDFINGKIFVDVPYPYTSHFLNYLKGYKNIWENKENFLSLKSLIELLKEMNEDDCVSVENILKAFLYRENNTELINFNDSKDYIYINEANSERARIYLYEEYVEYVVEPFVKSLLFILGTLGILELYYTKPKDCESLYIKTGYLSKYDGLKFIKLTDFGKFIFDKTTNYSMPKSYEKVEVFLDEKQLILTVVGEAPAKRIFFERIAKKIGENSYKLSFVTFKKGLKTKENFIERLEKFKNNLNNKEIPLNWLEFFDEFKRKFDSIERTDDYIVYKIPEDKELIDIILNDKKIREHILKAEQYHILIEKAKLESFKKLLGEYGYYFNL